MSTPNIEELMALADRYATLRIGEGTANARKELQNALQSQEAAMRKALELGKKYAKCLMMNQAPFDEALAALAQQGEPVCAGCGIPVGDVHMSTCKSGKWPSRVSNGDTAAPAPQAQGETK